MTGEVVLRVKGQQDQSEKAWQQYSVFIYCCRNTGWSSVSR